MSYRHQDPPSLHTAYLIAGPLHGSHHECSNLDSCWRTLPAPALRFHAVTAVQITLTDRQGGPPAHYGIIGRSTAGEIIAIAVGGNLYP